MAQQLISIVTVKTGKVHAFDYATNNDAHTLCGRDVTGTLDEAELFIGNICKQCAKHVDLAFRIPKPPTAEPVGDIAPLLAAIQNAADTYHAFEGNGKRRHGMVRHMRSLRRQAMKAQLKALAA